MIDEKFFLTRTSVLIRELRKKKGLSQEEFSHLINIDRKYASLIEKGDRNLSILMLLKITKGLGISLEEFFKNY